MDKKKVAVFILPLLCLVVLIIVIVVVVLVTLPQVEPLQEVTSYELRRTSGKGTFNETQIMCTEMGGQLVQDILTKNIGGKTYKNEMIAIMANETCWVGITDLLEEGEWLYLNGDKFPNSTSGLIVDWDQGEPNNVGLNGEDYAQAVIKNGSIVLLDQGMEPGDQEWKKFSGCCEIATGKQ